jgi:hypothetical protein
LVKVNASECPDEIGRPDNAADWEEKIFKTGIPQKTRGGDDLPSEQIRNPEPGDHLLIWINDGPDGGGTGLTATAKVSDFRPLGKPEMVIKRIELFPAPRLDRTDLQDGQFNQYPVFDDVQRSRLVSLRYIDHKGWNAILEAAADKIARAARDNSRVTSEEGKRLYRESVQLERNRDFVKLVKERNRHLHGGVYQCQACSFSADLSSLFDAHHLVPLCLGERQTEVVDFAVLCPTCHRLAHRLGPTLYDPLSVSSIKSWWQNRGSKNAATNACLAAVRECSPYPGAVHRGGLASR